MGNSKKKSDSKLSVWFKGLKGQFRTISWPSREDATKQSVAVVVSSVILGVIIAVVDVIIRFGLEFIIK